MLHYETLNSEETESLHKIQLEIFKEFILICKELNLKYYVIGGTALGTLRHGGFIPWDDDIDVGMPRSSYELFLKEAPKIISNQYFIQTHITDRFYPHNFAKIRDNNTTFIERNVKHLDINHGVYIDIFPLDGVSSSSIYNFFFKMKNKILTKKINEFFDLTMFQERRTLKSRVFQIFVNFLLFRYNNQELVFMKDTLLKKKKYEDCDTIANFCGSWGEKEIVPKSYFGEGRKMKFEDLNVVIPEKIEDYLLRLYGDYMKLPPIQNRITHHYCSRIDLTKSYKCYIK